MASISGKETSPEIIVRNFLFSNGFRFRKNVKHLPGTPDVVLPKFKTAIFVHGCFWHGHKRCKYAKLPETRKEFWKKKIETNMMRDKKNIMVLKKLGWKVLTVWQCDISSKYKLAKRMVRLIDQIKK